MHCVKTRSCAQCTHLRPRPRSQRRVASSGRRVAASCRCSLGRVAASCRCSLGRITVPCRYPLSRHKIVSRYKVMSRALGRIAAPCRALLPLAHYAPARLCAGPCSPRPYLSRYNTLYRDQDWKMGIAHPSFLSTFFFSFICFSFVRLIIKPQKKKYYYYYFYIFQ